MDAVDDDKKQQGNAYNDRVSVDKQAIVLVSNQLRRTSHHTFRLILVCHHTSIDMKTLLQQVLLMLVAIVLASNMSSIMALADDDVIHPSNCTTTTPKAAFDPADYQLHAHFPPNKTATWTYGIGYDGWLLAHKGLRGELQDFAEALESMLSQTSVTVEKAQKQALQKWWRGHLKHMTSHHRNEDSIAKKFAEKRFRWPDFVEMDHEEINRHIESIKPLIQFIVRDSSSISMGHIVQLRTLWKDYHAIVARHLDQEEDVCITLMRAYFTQQQVQRMQHRLAMMGPRVEMGAIAYYVGFQVLEESTVAQKTPKILRWVGISLILKPRHWFYLKTMVKQLEVMRGKTVQ
jgi:hypothetical protein